METKANDQQKDELVVVSYTIRKLGSTLPGKYDKILYKPLDKRELSWNSHL